MMMRIMMMIIIIIIIIINFRHPITYHKGIERE
jgi:hypothetical protein